MKESRTDEGKVENKTIEYLYLVIVKDVLQSMLYV